MERKLLIWSTIVVILGFALAAYFTPEINPHVIDTESQVSFGDPSASVRVVVFEEFACVQCKQFHNDVIKPLFDNYIDKKKVFLTLIPVAYLDPSFPAFSAACCLGKVSPNQMRFFLDHIFHLDGQEMVSLSPEGLIESYGLNQDLFPLADVLKCIQSDDINKTRESRIKLASKIYNEEIHMPTVLVNGKLISIPDKQSLFNTIEKELAKEKTSD